MNSPTSKFTVLVADDDGMFRSLVQAALGPSNYTIVEAKNGVDAVNRYKESHPDIVLLDVMMPERDGFLVCEDIRQSPNGANIPIVIITSMEDMDSIKKAFQAGATDFLTKPVDWSLLALRVSFLLRANQKILNVLQRVMEPGMLDALLEERLQPVKPLEDQILQAVQSLESELGSHILKEMLSAISESVSDWKPTLEMEDTGVIPSPVSALEESILLRRRLQEMQLDVDYVNRFLQQMIDEAPRRIHQIEQAVHHRYFAEVMQEVLSFKVRCEWIGAQGLCAILDEMSLGSGTDFFERCEEAIQRLYQEWSNVKEKIHDELMLVSSSVDDG